MYDTVVKHVVDDVLCGFNGTIFAYGQTSSGKTFTMEGLLGQNDLEGIIPRLSKDIFNFIASKDKDLIFTTKVLQIFQYLFNYIADIKFPNIHGENSGFIR